MKKINLFTTLDELQRGNDYFLTEYDYVINIEISEKVAKSINHRNDRRLFEVSIPKWKRINKDVALISLNDLIYGFGSY